MPAPPSWREQLPAHVIRELEDLVHSGYLALFTDDAGVERVALTLKGFDFLERVLPHLESDAAEPSP